jgi:glycosyltransferase involved in cell wall biosynthesis
VTELMVGGAENMLWKLLSRIDRTRFTPSIIALSGRADGILERFRSINVPCELLGMRPRFWASLRLLTLSRCLTRSRPDVIQGWMYHGNVAATIANLFSRNRAPVLWNVRGTLPNSRENNWRSSFVIRLSGMLSSAPVRVINNSITSAIEHEERLGYPPHSRVLLANGFDTELFRPSREAHATLRQQCGLGADTLLIGLVSREHPMKDHRNFLSAAATLNRTHSHVHFCIVGEKLDARNSRLNALISEAGLSARVHLLGRRDDMERVTAGFDIACSASAYGEGFANVIGEAMSCGVPCAVTDIGDSARIVQETGRIVPPRDPAALAHALQDLIEIGGNARRVLGLQARERIVQHFSLDAIVKQYEELYVRIYDERAVGTIPLPPVQAQR